MPLAFLHAPVVYIHLHKLMVIHFAHHNDALWCHPCWFNCTSCTGCEPFELVAGWWWGVYGSVRGCVRWRWRRGGGRGGRGREGEGKGREGRMGEKDTAVGLQESDSHCISR